MLRMFPKTILFPTDEDDETKTPLSDASIYLTWPSNAANETMDVEGAKLSELDESAAVLAYPDLQQSQDESEAVLPYPESKECQVFPLVSNKDIDMSVDMSDFRSFGNELYPEERQENPYRGFADSFVQKESPSQEMQSWNRVKKKDSQQKKELSQFDQQRSRLSGPPASNLLGMLGFGLVRKAIKPRESLHVPKKKLKPVNIPRFMTKTDSSAASSSTRSFSTFANIDPELVKLASIGSRKRKSSYRSSKCFPFSQAKKGSIFINS